MKHFKKGPKALKAYMEGKLPRKQKKAYRNYISAKGKFMNQRVRGIIIDDFPRDLPKEAVEQLRELYTMKIPGICYD